MENTSGCCKKQQLFTVLSMVFIFFGQAETIARVELRNQGTITIALRQILKV